MKTTHFILAIGILIFSIGCAATDLKNDKQKPQVVFDEQIGSSEKEIKTIYGSPQQEFIKKAGDEGGELRSALLHKVSSKEVQIKEIYYKNEKGEKIFWLTKQLDGTWKVISNVSIPSGVAF